MSKATGILIELDNIHSVKLYIDGQYSNVDWKAKQDSIISGVYSCPPCPNTSIIESGLSIEKSIDNTGIIRITETKQYRLEIETKDGSAVELPYIPNEGKLLKCKRDKYSMSIQFVNYLGRSRLRFTKPLREIQIEVVPDKINYELDYIELTEAIARNCASLLLEHAGSTYMMFSQDNRSSKTVLEQFIFLRQFCYSDNLVSLFEAIKRNPDRVLEKEELFKQVGAGIPSKKFFTQPFTYGKEWTHMTSSINGKDIYLPQRIAITRKYDSVDTPSNRLIKFAFEKFDYICRSIIDSSHTLNASECVNEAIRMHQMFDIILHDSFFYDIGELDIVPLNNQVLLKREGYSQIFAAFSMIDLALQLNWKGQGEVYEGESKNVALLYEYWLFFELYKIIKSLKSCTPIKTDENPFISFDEGLTISLKESNISCQSFELVDEKTKINLYYNRTFSPNDFISTGYEGSYSRPFRPDYTLAVFPSSYKNENEAIIGGAVSFIHFDAKYRVDRVTYLVGNIDNETSVDELNEEKHDAITNTYKRGDLLKMHTYNDAIRRTVGSYVLFPGTTTDDIKTYKLYDELLPGVGAFAIKPSIQKVSENTISSFIMDLIRARKQNASRLGRLDQYKEMVIREPGTIKTDIIDNQEIYRCILGYLRANRTDDYYYFLLENHKFVPGERFPFYFYAIKDGYIYSHHKDVFSTKYIRFYVNNIYKDDSYELTPLICRIESNELVSREGLVQRLIKLGFETSIDRHQADYYFILNVVVDNDCAPTLSLPSSTVNNTNGNESYSPLSPKIIIIDKVNKLTHQLI